jgi:hypothetical protein
VQQRGVNLEIVMVNVWEHVNARDEAIGFMKRFNIAGPVLVDAQGDYINELGLRGVPHNIIVDKKGIVKAVGTTTPDEVRGTLMRLLMPFG